MLIDLKKIAEGGLHVDRALDLSGSEVDPEVISVGPARVVVDVHEVEDEVVITGSFEVEAIVACARCLAPFNLSVANRFTSIYRYRPTDLKEDAQVKDEELDLSYLDPEQQEMDLKEIVWEQILLNLPMKPLHHSDCKGLCPGCGIDKNEKECDCETTSLDPRLEELAKIRAAMDTKRES